jgi:hypothetical protein
LKPNLREITTQIRSLLKSARESTMTVAGLIATARNCFEGELDWLIWGKKEFAFARRSMFRMARVSDFLKKCRMRHCAQEDECRMRHLDAIHDYTKIDTLSAIPPEKLLEFLKDHDANELTRDELREAVRLFLGIAARTDSPGAFVRRVLSIPTTEELRAHFAQLKGRIDGRDHWRNRIYAHASLAAQAMIDRDDVAGLREMEANLVATAQHIQTHIRKLAGD